MIENVNKTQLIDLKAEVQTFTSRTHYKPAEMPDQCLPGSAKSIFEEIPELYGKDIAKAELHMDKASSYKSKSTATYLAKKESETQE
ncbi:hypothetical protein TNCV_3489611 [Trichonephila clavipes]|nr:hypothetical protein TNCV_3489611 [Trichonephila clavipes]